MKNELTPQENKDNTMAESEGKFIVYMLREENTSRAERQQNVYDYVRDLQIRYNKQPEIVEDVLRIVRLELKDRSDLLKIIDGVADKRESTIEHPTQESGVSLEKLKKTYGLNLEKMEQAYRFLFNCVDPEVFIDYRLYFRSGLLEQIQTSIREYGHLETYQALEKLKNEWEKQDENLRRNIFLDGLRKQMDIMKDVKKD
ncbi:MAG TPA: hypothetical protein PLH37_02640 [bacterium]|nr:hypothetical protein [bacterium]